MTRDEAVSPLRSFDDQTIIEAATEYFNVGGADWDGDSLTLKRQENWHSVSDQYLCNFAESFLKA